MKANWTIVNRRNFLKGAAVGCIAAGTGMLSGCAPTVSSSDATVENERDWKTPPEAIDASLIKETVEADLVVVGAGTSGIPAALTAVENGAKTVLLEKGESYFAAPNWFGGIGSRYMKALGVELDRSEIVGDLMWYANYSADQRLINLWFDNSGEAIDWYGDKLEQDGTLEFAVETDTKDTGGKRLSPIISHVPVEKPYKEMKQNEMGTRLSSPILLNMAVELGLDLRYLTPAVQLVKESDRVTGVIAQNADEEYIQFNASKGVILATGGYSFNRYLMEQLNPAQTLNKTESAEDKGGDGFKMGV